jgi:hypothetical protein
LNPDLRNRNMTNTFRRLILGVFIVGIFLTNDVYADTFEFLTFTAPSGWTKQPVQDGMTYRRPNGVGLIYFYNSLASTGAAADEFVKMWRARVEPTLPGPAPQPHLEQDAHYSVAIGAKTVDAQGTPTYISLVIFVGRGRALGFLTMSAGNDIQRELATFFQSLDTTPPGNVGGPGGGGGDIDIDFTPPPGYTSQRDGRMIVLKPTTIDRTTPCVYGISPARPSRGNLEADARTALLEPLPGWQIKSDHYNAMRGTSGAGWPYYWYRTDVRRLVGPSYENLTAMAMAFPSGPNRVSIFWGFGSTGVCNVDDMTFLRLFFSLRAHGVTADGGKALARELQGRWRDTQNTGMAQYRFRPDGRYDYGLGTSTTFGNLETRTGSVGDGRWELRGSDLTMTGSRAGKYRVRIYDEFLGGVWRRAMSLLNEGAKPALDVQYMRIEGP